LDKCGERGYILVSCARINIVYMYHSCNSNIVQVPRNNKKSEYYRLSTRKSLKISKGVIRNSDLKDSRKNKDKNKQ
jgi:hypothetical protein